MLFDDCRHKPVLTGQRVMGWFQKDNQPRGDKAKPVISYGDEARCASCHVRLIIHDETLGFSSRITELSEEPTPVAA